ncbi:trimethylamine methyltransferase family protein [Ostreiculturibacter nitratireducens]|uniref:trimethylamine methyltransferase family protein n=1 Tax=Ostreiculturibacter nitratireducens TaxID=3075226 RepID=UPI0031B62466
MRDGGRRARETRGGGERARRYHGLRHPFAPQRVFSDDAIAAIHGNALKILEELGLVVLLPEARALYRAAGASVDKDTGLVRIGREIVEAALASAPRSIRLRARDPARDVLLEPGAMVFHAGAGCPQAHDRERGRRPGRLEDFREIMRLIDGFDAIHLMAAAVEPQDSPVVRRHYDTTLIQLETSTKVPFIYARGRAQVTEAFEMLAMASRTGADFAADPQCFTVINTNSPRILDAPMAEGIIDFARAGQVTMITPFCLMGAMAPVTLAGALSLQHAEALAGITLAQLARAGAPVLYGAFASNVAMKSGAPAFGTPEHMLATLASGQLARHIGLPWRGSSGAAANMADAQGATETTLATMAAMMAGATVTIHAAGWLEGGLTFGYEKFITDLEVLQSLAELCTVPGADPEDLAFEAIASVPPGGHFFGSEHTMSRYRTAFYEPLVADWSNFGQWTEAGSLRADERATRIWKERLASFTPAKGVEEGLDSARAFASRRIAEGGAAPSS